MMIMKSQSEKNHEGLCCKNPGLFCKNTGLFCKNTWLLLKEEIWQDVGAIVFTHLFHHVLDLVWSTLRVIRNSHCNTLQHTATHCNTPNYTRHTSIILLVCSTLIVIHSTRQHSVDLETRCTHSEFKCTAYTNIQVCIYTYMYIYMCVYVNLHINIYVYKCV